MDNFHDLQKSDYVVNQVQQTISKQSPLKTILLVFDDGNDKCYWDLDCTNSELLVFTDEMDIYNAWIQTLLSGKASLLSYEDPTDAANYQKSYIDRLSHNYLLSVIDIENKDEDDEGGVEAYLNGEANLGSMSELRQMLTQKHGHEEFCMGYMILPMSEIIFGRKETK